jgi:transposase
MAGETIEIITGRERRRRWSSTDKLRIVAETYETGACVKQVAARHDLSPGLVFTWRRHARDGMLAQPQPPPVFLPVRAAEAAPSQTDLGPPAPRADDRIEIELKDGSRVRVGAGVSLVSLRRVIAALRG